MREGKDETYTETQKRIEALLAKMDQSRGQGVLTEDIAQLAKRLKAVDACRDFMHLMSQPWNPADFVEKIAVLKGADVAISKNLYLMEYQQKLQSALVVGNAELACEMCMGDCEEVGKLVSLGFDISSAANVAEGCLLDSVLVLATTGLCKLEQQREPAARSTTKAAILQLINSIRAASGLGEAFLAMGCF